MNFYFSLIINYFSVYNHKSQTLILYFSNYKLKLPSITTIKNNLRIYLRGEILN